MLHTTIVTTDPENGSELAVPTTLLDGVRRASMLLESELGEIVEKFGISATWRFLRNKDNKLLVKLDLTSQQSPQIEVSVVDTSFNATDFLDDRTILEHLRPVMSKLGQMLASLVRARFEQIRLRINQDLEALTAISEE